MAECDPKPRGVGRDGTPDPRPKAGKLTRAPTLLTGVWETALTRVWGKSVIAEAIRYGLKLGTGSFAFSTTAASNSTPTLQQFHL